MWPGPRTNPSPLEVDRKRGRRGNRQPGGTTAEAEAVESRSYRTRRRRRPRRADGTRRLESPLHATGAGSGRRRQTPARASRTGHRGRSAVRTKARRALPGPGLPGRRLRSGESDGGGRAGTGAWAWTGHRGVRVGPAAAPPPRPHTTCNGRCGVPLAGRRSCAAHRRHRRRSPRWPGGRWSRSEVRPRTGFHHGCRIESLSSSPHDTRWCSASCCDTYRGACCTLVDNVRGRRGVPLRLYRWSETVRAAARWSRSACRPRWMRLRTVPSLTPSVAPISS